MWRVLETELRKLLTGHEGGNAGYSQGVSFELVAPALDPTKRKVEDCEHFVLPIQAKRVQGFDEKVETLAYSANEYSKFLSAADKFGNRDTRQR